MVDKATQWKFSLLYFANKSNLLVSGKQSSWIPSKLAVCLLCLSSNFQITARFGDMAETDAGDLTNIDQLWSNLIIQVTKCSMQMMNCDMNGTTGQFCTWVGPKCQLNPSTTPLGLVEHSVNHCQPCLLNLMFFVIFPMLKFTICHFWRHFLWVFNCSTGRTAEPPRSAALAASRRWTKLSSASAREDWAPHSGDGKNCFETRRKFRG